MWSGRIATLAAVQLVALAASFPIASIRCPRPSAQALAYCHQHSASTCCRPQHDQQILQDMAGLHMFTGSNSFSAACIEWTSRMACSVCDPRLSGPDPLYTEVCPATCRTWFQACRRDFFATSTRSGFLAPCNPTSLICTRLDDLFPDDPVGFCTSAGFRVAVANSDKCFAGDDPKPQQPPRKYYRQPVTEAQSLWAGIGTALIVVAVGALLFRWIASAPAVMTEEEIVARRARFVQAWAERQAVSRRNDEIEMLSDDGAPLTETNSLNCPESDGPHSESGSSKSFASSLNT